MANSRFGVISLFLLSCMTLITGQYLNEWLVEIPGGLEDAKAVAKEYGFQLVKKLSELGDVYLLRKGHTESIHGHPTVMFPIKDLTNASNFDARSRRSVLRKRGGNEKLERDHRIRYVAQQKVLIREKRDFVDIPKTLLDDNEERVFPFFSSAGNARSSRREEEAFNDPLWYTQWYLKTPGLSMGRSMRAIDSPESISLNVVPAWKAGYTGSGVVVTILDDGVETNHSDLAINYDPKASFNINGNNGDPTPRYERPEDTHHGTRCAGEVAMQANNSICGVGIAYNARIGGIRMLDGTITDRVEAEAFSFQSNYIDIYSSSWGPSDNGRTVEKPGKMAARALEKGVAEGRNGKGSLYIWASGNGGVNGDSCAYDGYASNIHTLSVGSTTEFGRVPIYAEQCPSTMACTYSSGSDYEGKIVSTDLLNRCTSSHTGTSASAPLAAGMIALLLESNTAVQTNTSGRIMQSFYVNRREPGDGKEILYPTQPDNQLFTPELTRTPSLTWRDIKHIVAWTADPFPLLRTPGWYVNGVGMLVHPVFGFGLMDAAKMIEGAQIWPTVPPKRKCAVRKAGIENSIFKHKRPFTASVTTRACRDTPNEIRFLEHVEVVVSLVHLRRGAVQISLESPMGTNTLIAPKRAGDASLNGFVEWPFVSVHTWGENPAGIWKVTFESHNDSSAVLGAVNSLTIVLHGTYDEPSGTAALREIRRQQTSNALSDVSKR